MFCLWSRGPAAPLNPPARGHSPGSPFLPPTCHVNMPLLSCQKMFPHHSIICHLRASNPRPQLTKCVLLPDMAHISGAASNQGLGPGSYDCWVSVHPVCLKSAHLLHWLDRYSIKPRCHRRFWLLLGTPVAATLERNAHASHCLNRSK